MAYGYGCIWLMAYGYGKDSLWLSLLQGSSDFSLVSKVPQVKNRLFPTKHLPLCKPLRFAS